MRAAMKSIFLAASACMAMTLSTATSTEAAPRRWDGFYVGIQAGAGTGNFDTRILPDLGIAPPNFLIGQDQNGLVGGGLVGFNVMNGPWLIGLESSFMWTGISGAGDRQSPFDPDWVIHMRAELDWIASTVVRLGYANDSTLIYGKGGIALTDFSMRGYSTYLGAFMGGATANDRRTGWTVGLGAEFALAGAWSARLDYDYYNFGKERVDAGGTLLSIDVQQHVGRIGLSYALGGGR